MSSTVKTKQGQAVPYTAIPQPFPNQPDSIIAAVNALKQAVETLGGARGPPAAHAVTFNNLGSAIVFGVTQGTLPPYLAVGIPIPGSPVPPSLVAAPKLGLTQAQVLARISVEVVR